MRGQGPGFPLSPDQEGWLTQPQMHTYLHLAPGAQLRSAAVPMPGAVMGAVLPWEGQKRPDVAEPSHLFPSLPLAFCGAEPIISQAVKQRKKLSWEEFLFT